MKVVIFYRFKDGDLFAKEYPISSLEKTISMLQEELLEDDNSCVDRFDVYDNETGDVYRVWGDMVERV